MTRACPCGRPLKRRYRHCTRCRAKARGIVLRDPATAASLAPSLLEQIARLYQSGLSINATARRLGLGDTMVRSSLLRSGVTLRPAKGRSA